MHYNPTFIGTMPEQQILYQVVPKDFRKTCNSGHRDILYDDLGSRNRICNLQHRNKRSVASAVICVCIDPNCLYEVDSICSLNLASNSSRTEIKSRCVGYGCSISLDVALLLNSITKPITLQGRWCSIQKVITLWECAGHDHRFHTSASWCL